MFCVFCFFRDLVFTSLHLESPESEKADLRETITVNIFFLRDADVALVYSNLMHLNVYVAVCVLVFCNNKGPFSGYFVIYPNKHACKDNRFTNQSMSASVMIGSGNLHFQFVSTEGFLVGHSCHAP